MGMNDVPRCQHVKINGTQCGSPALRRKRHCYFHHRMRDGSRRYGQDQVKPRPMYTMGLLEDANSVQVAIMQVLEQLACGQMEPKVAGLMLYGLQIASSNLKHTRFEAMSSTDVVIDRDDVDRTCIRGPQWYESDFGAEARQQQPLAENEEEESENEEDSGGEDLIAEDLAEDDTVEEDSSEEDSGGEDLTEEDSNENEEEENAVEQAAASARLMKAPVDVNMEEVRKRVQGVIGKFLLDMVPEKSTASPG